MTVIPRWAPPIAGAAAAVFATGLGELTAAIVAPTSSPISVVGATLIQLAPSWAVDAAIAVFGTADKIALSVGVIAVLLILTALLGVLEVRRPPWGAVVVAALGVGVAMLSMTRPDANQLSWAPALIAGAAGFAGLRFTVSRIRFESRSNEQSDAASTSRRQFIIATGAAFGLGVLASIGSTVVGASTRVVETIRSALSLPTPAVLAAPVPAGAELGLQGLAPVVTPNTAFFRIDTALVVPQIDPETWSLRIHGLVESEVTITWDELLALPLEEHWTTLACVSNPVGGDLIGNAKWLGYPIRELLARARPRPDADMVLSRSIDGFTASTPLEALTDAGRDAILAVGMNDEPLPAQHGFPVRMVVPGLYGYVSATKWVTELEVTRFDRATAYWTDRGWTERGPVKLQSRIDVPRGREALAAGETVIAGVAWHQHTGIAGVQVQLDDGQWQDAQLAEAISDDTWVQWSIPWIAEPGTTTIRCRAISNDGETQTAASAPPHPDGATGWDELTVTVE
jgi:DMSO/TMAO reductase YedYZ molybdopterin-dependent catalytic subunit